MVKLPDRLIAPGASHVTSSGTRGNCSGDGNDWLRLALADWNLVRLRATRMNEGALASPLLLSSASVTEDWKSAMAETK